MVFKGNDKPIINMNKHIASMKADSGKKAKSSPFQQTKDQWGKIKKGQYPNLVENQSKVQKDKKGLYTTGIGKHGHHTESDTTRYPKGFSDWKGKVKKGDHIDETTHEAWGGVDVEGKGGATGKRKVYNKKTGKYEDYVSNPMDTKKKSKKKSPLEQTKFNPDGTVDSTPPGQKTTKASGLSWGAVAKNRKEGGDSYSAVKGMQDRHATREFHKDEKDRELNTDLGGGGMRPTLG